MTPSSSIYLDHNSTTSISPEVARRMAEIMALPLANPASQHRPGRKALSILEKSRDLLLSFLGCSSSGMHTPSLIWTSGGTEANNLAIIGLGTSRPGTIILGATEHPSVLETMNLPHWSPERFRLLPVDASGRYDLERLEHWLQAGSPIALVSLMLGNNETGVLQDIPAAGRLCAARGIPLHCDAVQAVGKIPLRFDELGVSALTLTAHKIHGPVGIGALVIAPGVSIPPMLAGGGQQLGIRAGTEPVMLAAAFAVAAEEMQLALAAGVYEELRLLRDRFETTVVERCGGHVIAEDAPRLPHTTNIAFPGLDRQALHMALDLDGVACSTGSACSSGSSRPSHVLQAMQLPPEWIAGSLRFSLARTTTISELEQAAERIEQVMARFRSPTSLKK